MSTVTLRWVGASDADSNTDYKVRYNSVAAGTFSDVVTQDATAPFAPVTQTLSGAHSAATTTITLADGTNFSEGDYIFVGKKEMVLLGSKSGSVFSNSTRGVGGTLPVAHAGGVAVAKAHESYVHNSVTFPDGRYALRYRIIRIQGSNESVAAELLAIQPPNPPATNLCTVYGLLDNLNGAPASGVQVKLEYLSAGNYGPDTGEVIHIPAVTAVTDADGFWYHFVRRDAAREGVSVVHFTVAPGAVGEFVWVVSAIPDADFAHLLET